VHGSVGLRPTERKAAPLKALATTKAGPANMSARPPLRWRRNNSAASAGILLLTKGAPPSTGLWSVCRRLASPRPLVNGGRGGRGIYVAAPKQPRPSDPTHTWVSHCSSTPLWQPAAAAPPITERRPLRNRRPRGIATLMGTHTYGFARPTPRALHRSPVGERRPRGAREAAVVSPPSPLARPPHPSYSTAILVIRAHHAALRMHHAAVGHAVGDLPPK